jgi:hypothetical protein
VTVFVKVGFLEVQIPIFGKELFERDSELLWRYETFFDHIMMEHRLDDGLSGLLGCRSETTSWMKKARKKKL